MLRAGKTQREVAEKFGVSQGAVSNAITRGNIKADTNRVVSRAVPWHPIKPEHRDKYLVRMLRAHHRRVNGLKNAPVLEAMLDTFLVAMERDGFVIDYQPDTEDGFVRVPRREGIDTGLVRDPELDNRGREWAASRPPSGP